MAICPPLKSYRIYILKQDYLHKYEGDFVIDATQTWKVNDYVDNGYLSYIIHNYVPCYLNEGDIKTKTVWPIPFAMLEEQGDILYEDDMKPEVDKSNEKTLTINNYKEIVDKLAKTAGDGKYFDELWKELLEDTLMKNNKDFKKIVGYYYDVKEKYE